MEYFMLDLIREGAQVDMQRIEYFALRRVCGEVADQGAFGRVFAELFQIGLVILHDAHLLRSLPLSITLSGR
jgi:hypothetical protein